MITDQELNQMRVPVVQLEGKVAFLYRQLGVTFVPEAVPGDDPRIIEQLKKGKMLQAIKIHRELTHADYNTARQAVE
jgi:hypothetical protein